MTNLKWLDKVETLLKKSSNKDDNDLINDVIYCLKRRLQEKPKSLAGAVYTAQAITSCYEDIIYYLIKSSFENGVDNIKCFDEYDYSIEFWVQKGTKLSKKDLKVLRDLGFYKCWLCVEDGTKDDEVYYELYY